MHSFFRASRRRINRFVRYSQRDFRLTSGLIVGGATIYVNQRMNIVYNDANAFALLGEEERHSSIPQAAIAEESLEVALSLAEKAKKRIIAIFKAIQDFARYFQRIVTYTALGMPLTGLVPLAYIAGDTIPAIGDFTWDYMVWAIIKLGPTFIKLAQWASTRPDLFPPSLVERLESLQADVKVHNPMEKVEATLTEAFGEHWRDNLELNEKPLGTGSIAQVFQGKLRNPVDGTRTNVAVKMIHPHINKLVKVDMELLSHIANFIDSFPNLEILSLGETCRQFAETMKIQMDLRTEAQNLSSFTRKFANDKWAVFPSPIEGYVTENVLVETLVVGEPITKFMQMQPRSVGDGVEQLKLKLSDLCCRLMIKMVFFDNLIHGDLHPGNIMVQIQDDGNPKLVILDCGIVYRSKTEAEHEKLIDICLSFMQHDGRKAGRLMLENAALKDAAAAAAARKGLDKSKSASSVVSGQSFFGKLKDKAVTKVAQKISERRAHDLELPADASQTAAAISEREAKNAEDFCESIQKIVDAGETQNYFEHIGDYVSQMCTLAREHYVRLDPSYFRIAMALKVGEGVSLALNRELDLVTTCVPIILKTKAMRSMGLDKFPSPEEDALDNDSLLQRSRSKQFQNLLPWNWFSSRNDAVQEARDQ